MDKANRRQALEDRLEETIRSRLKDVIQKDGRTPAELARLSGLDGDMLRKFLRGDRWMDFRSLAPLAAVLRINIAFLAGGQDRLSGTLPEVPIIDSGRYPMDLDAKDRDKALEALKSGEAANLTSDPRAHWVRLQERFTVGQEVFRIGDLVLVAPQSSYVPGMPVAAIVNRRFALALPSKLDGIDCLTVNGTPYPTRDCLVLGPVDHHTRRLTP